MPAIHTLADAVQLERWFNFLPSNYLDLSDIEKRDAIIACVKRNIHACGQIIEDAEHLYTFQRGATTRFQAVQILLELLEPTHQREITTYAVSEVLRLEGAHIACIAAAIRDEGGDDHGGDPEWYDSRMVQLGSYAYRDMIVKQVPWNRLRGRDFSKASLLEAVSRTQEACVSMRRLGPARPVEFEEIEPGGSRNSVAD